MKNVFYLLCRDYLIRYHYVRSITYNRIIQQRPRNIFNKKYIWIITSCCEKKLPGNLLSSVKCSVTCDKN